MAADGQTDNLEDSTYHNRPLEQLFHSAAARIVDFFVLNEEFDYSESDVAKKTNLSYKTVSREIPQLEKTGIVRVTRKSGRTDMYKLNRDAKAVRGLQLFVSDILDKRFEEFAKANDVKPELEEGETQSRIY